MSQCSSSAKPLQPAVLKLLFRGHWRGECLVSSARWAAEVTGEMALSTLEPFPAWLLYDWIYCIDGSAISLCMDQYPSLPYHCNH